MLWNVRIFDILTYKFVFNKSPRKVLQSISEASTTSNGSAVSVSTIRNDIIEKTQMRYYIVTSRVKAKDLPQEIIRTSQKDLPMFFKNIQFHIVALVLKTLNYRRYEQLLWSFANLKSEEGAFSWLYFVRMYVFQSLEH